LWDLDPQGGSTYLLRIKPKVRGGGRRLLRQRSDVDELIKGTDHLGLDLLPADFSLRHMDLVLDRFKNPTRRLARVLEPLRDEYDYIFLDCPPSISLVSESVFEAADALLVPVIPATLSARTLRQLEEVVGENTSVLAFFSMVDRRKRQHREVIEQLTGDGTRVLAAAIPSSSVIERMGVDRDVVASFAPRSPAAVAYEELWREVKRRLPDR
ncbi:MAG: ParA family protein, partial [Solirubrobacterales bacterium]|nr:ParA family protein [Solirubrobacterales bacterium]